MTSVLGPAPPSQTVDRLWGGELWRPFLVIQGEMCRLLAAL